MDAAQAIPIEQTVRRPGQWRWLQWLVLPLLILVTADRITDRWARARHFDYWGAAAEVAGSRHIDLLFMGTSRVAAAVDTPTVSAEMERRLHRKVTVLNEGMGYTNLLQCYLGLRNLIAAHPGALKGTVVALEAPGGLPDSFDWSERWIVDDGIENLVPLLREQDLPAVWRSRMSLEDRLHLTVRCLGRRSALLTQRERIWRGLIARTKETVERRLERAGVVRAENQGAVDLSDAGGIRNDAEGVAAVRSAALAQFRREAGAQQPGEYARKPGVEQLVRLVQQAGGRMVFFEVPLHSAQAVVYETPVRRADRAYFAAKARAWGCPVIRPAFPVRDEDFPDVMHLARSRAPAYAAQLVAGWPVEALPSQ